ncbi:MAG: cyclase family protein [Allosphingosinicella sp.]
MSGRPIVDNSARGDLGSRLVELSHVIEHGMITYKGLPGPAICDFWEREGSKAFYDDGSSFQIGRIDMVANTGTYLDTPFHRFADGADLAGVGLEKLAALPGQIVRRPWQEGLAVGADAFEGLDLAGKAVLVHTRWDRLWRSPDYKENQPIMTPEAAGLLAKSGARLVGIDSCNIDDTRARSRPIHSILLRSGVPICEHLTGLAELPDSGFDFTAAPPRIVGMGTFPVRAFALLAG